MACSQPPQFLDNKFKEAILERDLSSVQRLLLANPTLAQYRSNNGETALHWAMPNEPKLRNDEEVEVEISTSLELSTILLQAGAHIDAQDKWGTTPLHLAAQSESAASVVELLIHHGALIDTKSCSPEVISGTPLHAALHFGWGIAPKTEVLELLLINGADANMQDSRGETALHRACQGGKEAAVEILLKYGANVDARNVLGRTPLMFAAYGESSRCMEMLKAEHANEMLVDNDGRDVGYFVATRKKKVEIEVENEKLRERASPSRGRGRGRG